MLPVALAVRQYSARVEAFRGLAAEAGLPLEVRASPARARTPPAAVRSVFARAAADAAVYRSDTLSCVHPAGPAS